jgi:pimeloyl-ACP methyl ester carboxylesterase
MDHDEHGTVRANGIDIHYVAAGAGEPLILLDAAVVSSDPMWAAVPMAYAGHLARLAEHFRVILPDTRGSGRTVHPGGPITHDLLADDAIALAEALDLGAPALAGFSDGGEVATVAALRHPGALRAVVNHGGYDLFNPDPDAPAAVMTRQMLGGAADATEADPDLVAQSNEVLSGLFALMRADHDAAQGPEHWRTVVATTFARITRPHGYTVDDLVKVTVPALILVGDRDPFCPVEEGAAAARALPAGELAVLPGTSHAITPAAVGAVIDFLSGLG